MITISIRELRAKTKEVLDMMSRGQKIVITSHGKPVAQLTPYKAEKNAPDESQAFGMWSDHDEMKDVKKYVRTLRKGRKLC